MVETFNWLGRDFGVYEVENDHLEQNWSEVGGLYVFARRVTGVPDASEWQALYVGKCQSFESRLPNHNKLPEVKPYGVFHVHLCPVENESCREQIEKEMIRTLNPPLNDQHRTSAAADSGAPGDRDPNATVTRGYSRI